MLNRLRGPWHTPGRIGLVGSAAITVTVHACWIQPTGHGLEARARLLETTRRDMETAARAAKRLRELERLMASLDRRQAVLKAAAVSAQEATGLLRDVQALSEGPDLSLTAFKPAAPVGRGSLTEWSVTVELEGSYAGILRFLADVADYPRVVVVSALRLRAADRGRADVSLTASCRLSTFVPASPAGNIPEAMGPPSTAPHDRAEQPVSNEPLP
jgi:Tfp pilus assembly protein PilO